MKKKLDELTGEVLNELEASGYSKLTRDNFRYFWNGMIRYFESKNIYEFNPEIAMEYFEIRCSKTDLKKRSKNFIKRAILILDHYNKYGEIPLRCYIPVSKLNNPQYFEILNSYGKYLVNGEYSLRTIEGYLSNVVRFMQFLERNEYLCIDKWSGEIMFKYIETLSEFKKATIKHNTGAVRLFLRYLYLENITNEDLSLYIGTVRGTYHQKLPSFWTKNEVSQLLNAIDQNNPNEKRDYAMILLVARLGLRSSDVKKLKFENLHWKENQIVIIQSKTGEPLTLPLLRDVGWAIIDYVQNARPKVDNPHVFLRHLPPYTELSERNHLYRTIEKYMLRARLPITAKKRNGMHSLRHSLATTLMEENIPLSDISDILGHTSVNSTSIYLNVDVNRLRDCAIEVNRLGVEQDGEF